MWRKRHKREEIVATPQSGWTCLRRKARRWLTRCARLARPKSPDPRWLQEHGELKSDRISRMKELELENQRLRSAVTNLTLDNLILAK